MSSEDDHSTLATSMNLPSYKFIVEGFLMPLVSVFGLLGNSMTLYILCNSEVKLKKDFVTVLCSLATFDNLLLLCSFSLFSLPNFSDFYKLKIFPFTVPYLYPATNTVMTCSIYMTAAVGINRYLDIVDCNRRIRCGRIQSAIVFVCALLVNVPRWFEFEYSYVTTSFNGTFNVTDVIARPTELRLNDDYVRYYTLISASTLIVFVPTAAMLVSTFLISREMMRVSRGSSGNSFLNDRQEQARRRRNRSITIMLIGIIVLFIVCHIGEIFMSLYEMYDLLDGERKSFPAWAKNIVTTNHLLLVINSSLNFIIYCRDVVFRRCVVMIYQAWGWRKTVAPSTQAVTFHMEAMQQLRSLNDELGISLQGDPSPENILRDLDPQSMILCGLSQCGRAESANNLKHCGGQETSRSSSRRQALTE